MNRLAVILAFLVLPFPALAQWQEKDLDTPYVPTPQVVVDQMLALARVKPGDMLIDLGSGDGRMVISAATERGAHGFGVEIDPRLVKLSNDNAAKAGVADRVKFLTQDLFQTDFSSADVLTLYLLPDVNMALRPKILAELRPGARVVAHDYGMQEWRPDAQEKVAAPDKTVGLKKESMVYLWIVPAKVEGEWALEIGGKKLPLVLKQRFQYVSGTVPVAGHGAVPVADGRLRGTELRMTLPGGVYGEEPVQMVAKVVGDSLMGDLRRGGKEVAACSARRVRRLE